MVVAGAHAPEARLDRAVRERDSTPRIAPSRSAIAGVAGARGHAARAERATRAARGRPRSRGRRRAGRARAGGCARPSASTRIVERTDPREHDRGHRPVVTAHAGAGSRRVRQWRGDRAAESGREGSITVPGPRSSGRRPGRRRAPGSRAGRCRSRRGDPGCGRKSSRAHAWRDRVANAVVRRSTPVIVWSVGRGDDRLGLRQVVELHARRAPAEHPLAEQRVDVHAAQALRLPVLRGHRAGLVVGDDEARRSRRDRGGR